MSGVLLATAGYDHTIRLWEAPSGVCYKTMQHPDSQVNKLEITPDKQYIAAAGNPSLRIYDINGSSPNALSSYDGHTNNITAVGFQKEGKWMFTGSEDGTIKIWDMRAPGCQREYESGSPLNTVMLHPNQAELISGDRDGNIRVWDLTQNACSAELVPDGAKAIRSVCISRDASLLAAANDAGSCFVWRLGRNEDSSAKFEPLQKLQAHATYVLKVIMSPDGKRLATCSADQTVKIWDIQNNFACDKTLTGHQRWVWDAVYSEDSAYLVTASSDQTARLWDVASGETIRHYTGHHKAVIAVALHDRNTGPGGGAA
uniref:Protein LST8 homolog n=1 Tax=Phaeocystis antarctica TaxID=33657 RepID=A0A7S0E798_9EUKA|mmetsp:Transcript_29045/g.69036  ORF Transcript_29045/g.69036 Transcript_29045/m.69036 type:complete len:315 (+) Transcript_29045:137-1081(+)